MKLDKNTVIGFSLLLVLFIGYFWYNASQRNEALAKAEDKQKEVEKARKDSIAKVEAAITPEQRNAMRLDSLKRDSLNRLSVAAGFGAGANGNETLTVVENDVLKASFTNKGGQLKSVELKNYKSSNGKNVVLGGAKDDKLNYPVKTSATTTAQTSELYFTASPINRNTDGSQTLVFTLNDSIGKTIKHEFSVKKDDYMVDWNIHFTGANEILDGGNVNFKWDIHPQQHENSADYEKQMSNVCFYENNDFDYISAKTQHSFEKNTNFVGAVQQFFNTSLLNTKGFNSGNVLFNRTTDTLTKTLAKVEATLQFKTDGAAQTTVPLKLYYGPNDYKALSKEPYEMEKIVNLGRDMYSFVRPINKYIIMPVFNFFAGFVSNYGWVILLLTLFIRLITSPLTYSSYLSGAKMKVLRPEIDALRAKYGDDKQGFAMAQMKLTNEAGANPLKGCLPAILQIPIFFALYSFFNSNIALRDQAFLWSSDLSTYDSIATLPFRIPGYGDHVSLFTITAVITSFLISIYNMSMTPQQDNPALKYMPYIFPFILLFIFNSLPAALTWYYTVSNLVTLGLQLIIQKFIIKPEKILAKIEERRKAPKKTSKWQERIQQMQEQQKKLQEMKNRAKK